MFGVLGVVVTGGSAPSADVVLFMNVVVCVVVVCEELVVSVNESISSVGVVFCVLLRSAFSADVVLFGVVKSACSAGVLVCVVVKSACSAGVA